MLRLLLVHDSAPLGVRIRIWCTVCPIRPPKGFVRSTDAMRWPEGQFLSSFKPGVTLQYADYLTNTQIDWLEGLQNHTLSHSFGL